MNRLRSWIRSFFGFSRGETNAFLILIPLMIAVIFSEPMYRYWFVRQPHDYSLEKKKLDSLLATWERKKDSFIAEEETTARPTKLFLFDPNQSAPEELINLGFSRFLANRIVNYRNKGGKFLVKKDLLKIYGMDSLLYKKLIPFISLPETVSKEKLVQKIEPKEKSIFSKFDLNAADTSQLIKIYGIGSKLSQRIINYREKLGGFIFDAQVKEVYGLDSTVVKELLSKSFIEENFKPKLISINSATEKELASHPYIKYKLAKAIVAYRIQHGKFSSTDDLKKIAVVDEKDFTKMRPYVSVE